MTIKTYNYNNKQYYKISDLMKVYVKLRICYNNDFLSNNKLTDPEHYIYVKRFKTNWIHCDKEDHETVFINSKWIDETYPQPYHLDYDDVDLVDLEEHEKFHDNKGNVVEIEVRGVKECDKCFFNVKDLEKGFNVKGIKRNVIDQRSGYELGKHYIRIRKGGNSTISLVYLTYLGVLRVLIASHTKLCDSFVNWTTKTLFTAQMGLMEDRFELVGNIIGATYDQVKEVLSKASVPVSCIYLIRIGSVKDLRKSMNINSRYPDDSSVYKYGLTNDLIRRMREHETSYGKIPGAHVTLYHYSLIDVSFIQEAENSLSNRFNLIKSKITYKNYKELIILDKTELKQVYKEYDDISRLYCCKMAYYNELIKEERHKYELLQKDMIIMEQKYQMEIMELKHRISTLVKNVS